MKTIELNSEGVKLKANLFYPEKLQEKNPAIIFIHGWTSNRTRNFPFAEALTALGYVGLTFDLRGHGESKVEPKSFSRQNFLTDVLTAYDHLASLENVDPENISVVGSSFGSYIGLVSTTKRKVKNLALRVPANYVDAGFDLPWWDKAFDENGHISLDALENYEGRVLIVESGGDVQVTHQTVENYRKAVSDQSKLTYVLMKGAPHSISRDEERIKEYTKILTNWFTMTV